MIANLFLKFICLFIFSKKLKASIKKHKRLPKSNRLKDKISFIELPTIRDCSNHLIPLFSDFNYEIVNALDSKATKEARKTSKILISETAISKRYSNQIAIEIWHASGFIKKACNLRGENIKPLDYVVCPSQNMKELYAKAFSVPEDKVLTFGSVKTDYLFDEQKCKKIKTDFFSKHPDLSAKKIYVWAPTFRNDWKSNPELFSALKLDKLDSLLADDEAFLIKLHPSLKYFSNNGTPRTNMLPQPHHKHIIDATDWLLDEVTLVCDVFISDYSSCILDAMVANKPILFFAEDLNEYEKNRGIPFDYRNDVPNLLENGSEEELIDALRKNHLKTSKYYEFKNKWLGACDGETGKRIRQFVMEAMLKL